MTRRFPLVWVLLVAAVAGCRSTGGGAAGPAGPASSGPVQELHLFSVPVPVSVTGGPSPDGFVIQVFASSRARARGIPVGRGTLEVSMYDGAVADSGTREAVLLKTWRFGAAELRSRVQKSTLGVGYRLVLGWGETRPTQASATIVVRYLPVQGPVIESTPTTLAVRPPS